MSQPTTTSYLPAPSVRRSWASAIGGALMSANNSATELIAVSRRLKCMLCCNPSPSEADERCCLYGSPPEAGCRRLADADAELQPDRTRELTRAHCPPGVSSLAGGNCARRAGDAPRRSDR